MKIVLKPTSAKVRENPVGFPLALLLAVGITIWTTAEFWRYWRATLPLQAATLHLQAVQPENGGWLGDRLRVTAGQPVRLVVEGVAGSHAFAIGHTAIASPAIMPGQEWIVEFIAPAPGRYVLYCTQWCSPNHWRMRTVLEVADPNNPDAALVYAQEAQRYQLPLAQMNLDTPHPAAMWPKERPNAAAGATAWARLWPDVSPTEAAAVLGWPLITPEQVYQNVSGASGSALPAPAQLSEQERWDVVAYLWQTQTTPQALATSAALYSQNCAACHGESGAGDGFAASFAPVAVPNLTDPTTAAGASPALYYAKIARGGIGTGMPNWGTIFREDELWALVATLHTFLFDDSQ
ncbi:MAG: hypothetical protein DWI57_08975 [Chloroflexi bacterium]|nr:MAG: hypothetical protein DWI57_08975 [Chloroflexota bacterium]